MLKQVQCKDLLKNISKITRNKYKPTLLSRIFGFIDIETAYQIIEDYKYIIENQKNIINDLENMNDYDPDIEIPLIHGKGISW